MGSIWTNGNNFEKHEMLQEDISVDTVIIGGGLAGILTAYLLKERGIDAVIIEAKEVCSGQTKNTTAKITSQHGLIYSKIEKYFGIEALKQYANANEQAIKEYRRIINEKNIACDFETTKAYLYSVEETDLLKKELESAKKSGIDCYLTDDVNLPFKTTGALVFNNQAQFNPLKFVSGLIDDLRIYENTPAIKIIGNTVYTPKAKIYAKNVVSACNYPFINFPAFYFFRMSRERSYVIAVEKGNVQLDGMYIGIGNDSISLRSYKDYILLGGGAHRTGAKLTSSPFDTLAEISSKLYPGHKIISSWSAQDCITLDSIPYIGKFGGKNESIYIATGFNKWGMTSSMVSARIICDMISGINSENAQIFSTDRFNIFASFKNILINTGETVKGFASHLKPSDCNIKNIKRNTAALIKYNGKKAGAYKDSDGKTYIVSVTCPHLKCMLNFNDATKTWDCPCHGSRFNYKGDLIDNPSQAKSILIDIV